jgi:hypothetical protein
MGNKEQSPAAGSNNKYSMSKIEPKTDYDYLQELLDDIIPAYAPDPKQIKLDSLRAQLHASEQNAKKGHEKRSLLVHLFFSICYLPLLLLVCAGLDIDFFSIFAFCFFAALLLGKVHFWANGAIIAYLNRMDKEDEEKLNAIRKRIKELEKELEK